MIRISALLLALLMTSSAFAQDNAPAGLTVEDPWSRATPPRARVAAGYLALVNSSDAPLTLERATADFADVELHTMTMQDGVMMMRELPDGIDIAPGETVTLAPGGLHVMFMNIQEPLVEGETRSAILDFGDAGALRVDFPVMALGAMHGPGHHGH